MGKEQKARREASIDSALADKVTKCFGLKSDETSTSLVRQHSKRFHDYSRKRHTWFDRTIGWEQNAREERGISFLSHFSRERNMSSLLNIAEKLSTRASTLAWNQSTQYLRSYQICDAVEVSEREMTFFFFWESSHFITNCTSQVKWTKKCFFILFQSATWLW